MKVLFVSGELIAGDLAYRLKKEGCDVSLYIDDDSRADCLDNIVKKNSNWKKELDWVGKDGLIVFDDVGYGKMQDDLRKKGYLVVGGCEKGDELELNRSYAQKIFEACGMNFLETINFNSIESAIKYIEDNPKAFVVKQNNHMSSFCFIGEDKDGKDVISLLRSYDNYCKKGFTISLQERVYGVEVGVARYFNGSDWVGPVEVNIEHKGFMNGNIGPLTAEMGTLMWYEEGENKLFKETLGKLRDYLIEIDYRGDIDINCIVYESKLFPLEATMRFGSPAIHLHDEIHLSPWKDFLMAIAKGDSFDLKYKRGYSIVVSIVIPPFPFRINDFNDYQRGVNILFKEELTEEEWEQIHYEEVSLRKENSKELYIAGNNGYILYVTGSGETIEEARKSVYDLINKLIIPKMMYRTDIGSNFMNTDGKLLKKWGWI